MLIVISSCNKIHSDEKFSIEGTISGDIPENIYLYYRGIPIDSAKTEMGKFHFEGNVDVPTEVYLVIPNRSSMVDDFFYIENGLIEMDVTVELKKMSGYEMNFIKINSINGSETEIIRKEFGRFKKSHKNDLDWNLKLYNKIDSILINHPNSQYSSRVLFNQLKENNLSYEQKINLYSKLDTTRMPIRTLEQFQQKLDSERILNVGKRIFDFSLPSIDNKIIRTNDFRGKIVLIEFWAAWCAPCRKQNPELLKVYKELKGKGFEVLGVSLDTNIEKWKATIKKDKLIWKNVIDTLAFEGRIAAKYNISSIPSNLLVGPDGVIISRNIEIPKIKKLVQLNNNQLKNP